MPTPAKASTSLEPLVHRGAEPVVGDASDQTYLINAFRGADAVYVLIPPKMTTFDFRAAARGAGDDADEVRRFR